MFVLQLRGTFAHDLRNQNTDRYLSNGGFATSFRGINRLGTAFFTLRWFRMAHLYSSN